MQLIMDATQARHPSCSQQCARLAELQAAGAELKMYRPVGNLAIMHQKTLVLDRAVYVCGSANLTGHAFDCNVEAVIVTRVASVVAAGVEHFRKLWAVATELTEAKIEEARAGRELRRSHSTAP